MLKIIKVTALLAGIFFAGTAYSQSYDELRWKNMANVKAILGEPLSKKGPVGTVRDYHIWKYENCIVAFTNGRVTHAFDWPLKSQVKL